MAKEEAGKTLVPGGRGAARSPGQNWRSRFSGEKKEGTERKVTHKNQKRTGNKQWWRKNRVKDFRGKVARRTSLEGGATRSCKRGSFWAADWD